MTRPASALCAVLLALVLVTPATAQQTAYGSTSFENSGAQAAQEPFLRGLLMLHSFEYVDARAAFQKAQEIDPDFAMAHWGEAMTHNHPIWMGQDRSAALSALQDLRSSPEAQLDAAPTEREKAYLKTLHVLYGAGTNEPQNKQARDDAYAKAMGDLAERCPDDLDAQAFHALSILGTAHEGRDFATYMRAAAIAEEVFDENPQHPGAAHYLIHAYDDPVHAPLGLRPARVYAGVAPAATHALHMPSHIFFALGMWDRGAESNVDAYEAAKAKAKEGASGLPGGGFHALHWLHYARLQQGRYDEARAVFDSTHRHISDPSVSTGYADHMRWYMPIAYTVETEQWDQLSELLEKMSVDPSSLEPEAAVGVHVAEGLSAAYQDDLATARSALEKAKDVFVDSLSTSATIQLHELEGVLAWKNGDSEHALSALKAATELEIERPLDYGPPSPPKPAPELYGEVLLALDRPEKALEQFNTALDRYPGRALSLSGKTRASAQAGQPGAAETARSKLSNQWDEADAHVRRRLQSLSNVTSATQAE